MFKLFKEQSIENAFNLVRQNINRKVDNIPKYDIMEENHDNLVKRISMKIQPLEIDFQSRKGKLDNEEINGQNFPQGYDVEPDKNYECAKAVYSFKITGDTELFAVEPKGKIFQKNVKASNNKNYLFIEYQTFSKQPLNENKINEIKDFIRETIRLMKDFIPVINNEIDTFNNQMNDYIKVQLKERKRQLQLKRSQDDNINDL